MKELPSVLIDHRPALFNREGIGRVARELVRALGELADAPPLALFGGGLRAPRVSREELGLPPDARLVAPRWPARFTAPLLRTLGGADRLFDAALVHHTQLRELPVSRRGASTLMVFDLMFTDGGSGWLDPRAARGMERRLRALLPKQRRVQVTSEVVRRDLVERGWFDDALVDAVPLGGDHVQRVEPLGEHEQARAVPSEPFLLTVSRLDPRKGHDLALAAFERLVDRGFDARWVIAGPPGYRADELWAELSASKHARRIEWRRLVDERELRALYEACTCFVFPSRAEGFGLPPIEAMWAGAPVVSSRATSLEEVVGLGADTFDPNEADAVDALAAALEQVVSDATYRRGLVERGRAWRERFTWRACAEASLASWRRALQ